MTGKLLNWLMKCPDLAGVSALALDCHELGLIDLRRQLARAIAADVRAKTSGGTLRMQTMSYHENLARILVTNRTAAIDIDDDVARVRGWVGRDAAISETRGRAVIHLRTQMPETLIGGVKGRRVGELVDCPLLRRHPFPIISAHQDEDGVYVWFCVPRTVWSMADVAAALDR